ncbi:DUF2868 domain-containing protein [Orrella sp. JC864]|uniref:DUF2868 domain-containing protein n=1 Tax=Orrella sp. JC864 TaxID=3120298 RepID=UPI0012BB8A81
MKRTRPALSCFWLAETLRLREAHWGPLDDGEAVRRARAQGGSLQDRMLARARWLGEQSGLARVVADWRRASLLALAVLLALALLAGASTAFGALGGGQRPVNVIWALGALLGLHALTFLLWPLGLLLRSEGAWLGQAWLWASRKLARGPDAALAPQAFATLLSRHGGLRWLLGAITHGIWLAGLSAALAALLVALSTRRYAFAWETTILEPETFVRVTRALGWLPQQLGFAMPDAAAILASDGLQAVPAAVQAQWSGWLVGALVVYGIAPRLLALLACAAQLWRVRARLGLDPNLPGLASLRDRLMPAVERLGPDAPEGTPELPQHRPGQAEAGQPCTGLVLAGIEIPSDLAWPRLPAGLHDAGIVDTREQRRVLLDRLAQAPARRLLLACDARQTPDRGTLRLLLELAGHAASTRVWLRAGERAEPARLQGWQAQLTQAGLPAQAITRDSQAALHWLQHGDKEDA